MDQAQAQTGEALLKVIPSHHGKFLAPEHFETIALSLIGGIIICWICFLVILRKHPELLQSVFAEGFVLRMLTVAFIVATVAMLAAGGMADNQAFSLLSGIAGFVLGGAQKKQQ